jgi:hypothetical protein
MPIKNPLFLTNSQIAQIERTLAKQKGVLRVVVTLDGGRKRKSFVTQSVRSYLAKRRTGRRVGKLNKKA